MNCCSLHCISSSEIPTYYCGNGSSVIDLVFVSFTSQTQNSLSVVHTPLTKHCQLHFNFSIPAKLNPKYNEKILRCDPLSLENRLNTLPFLASSDDLNQFYHCFATAIQDSGLKNKRRLSTAWFDRECAQLKKRVENCFKSMQLSKNVTALSELRNLKNQFKHTCQRKKGNLKAGKFCLI